MDAYTYTKKEYENLTYKLARIKDLEQYWVYVNFRGERLMSVLTIRT